MPTLRRPRHSTLQVWPRKRAAGYIPSVNWSAIKSDKKILGFIAYKAGMMSAMVKNSTPNSLTLNKKIVVPVTVLECPPMKILSIRFYKNGIPSTEVLSENLDKELQRKIRMPKKIKKIDEIKSEDYDDVRIVVYTEPKKADLKKTPDIVELALSGSKEDKLNLAKSHLHKEITISDVFNKGDLADFRGLTKGKGLCGPIKRYGLNLKSHKSEKGQRRPGSLAPWHPARATFHSPNAGQVGMFTRVIYNNKIVDIGKSNEKLKNIKNYGDVKTDYLIVKGSVQGPAKRQVLLTAPLRPWKTPAKLKYEMIELM